MLVGGGKKKKGGSLEELVREEDSFDVPPRIKP